jgi:hypothetical protein
MDPQEIKEIIIRELPSILRDDPEVRELVRRLNEGRFADKELTDSRFDRVLDELRRDSEARTAEWREALRQRAEDRRADAEKWAEQARLLAEHAAKFDRKFVESAGKSAEHEQKMERFAQQREEDKRADTEFRAEQARLHAEHAARFDRILDESTRKSAAHEAEMKRISDEAAKRSAAHEAEMKRISDEAAKKSAAHEAEMKRISDEAARRSAEHEQKMERFARQREEDKRADAEFRAEQARLHAEHVARMEHYARQEHEKWEANQKAINDLLSAITSLERQYHTTIGALGARWGLYSENSFRNALKGILEEDFGVEVVNVTDFDHEGEVFGRPDQVELDIIIKNGVLIACELKSSMSKSDMHIFDRKVRFYEKKHNRTVSRLIVISPMVDERAHKLAEKLGICVYSYPNKIDPATFS